MTDFATMQEDANALAGQTMAFATKNQAVINDDVRLYEIMQVILYRTGMLCGAISLQAKPSAILPTAAPWEGGAP